MLNIFGEFKLKWWQLAIYETAMISLGIFIGARFAFAFRSWVVFFLIIFILGGSYILRLWWKQVKNQKPIA